MTLTHILPTLRRSIPDPLRPDRWPAHTAAGIADITISGVSLLRLVDWCDTPCVHTAAAVAPGSSGRASSTELGSVVVMTVEDVTRTSAGDTVVTIDADLGSCRAVFSELRLIGRASTAPDAIVTLRAGSATSVDRARAETPAVRLPSDMRVGDLLVVPCLGVGPRLGDIRVHPVVVLSHCGR